MVIYLRHPIHGAKVACSDLEANYDRLHGWEPFDPTVPDAPEPVVVEEPVNELAVKRRGRPPKSLKE